MTITLEDLKGLPLYDNGEKPKDAKEGETRPKINKETREKYVPERGGKNKTSF